MRLSRKVFLDGLRLVTKGLSTRVGIPALAGVLLQKAADAFTLITTDLDRTLRVSFATSQEGEFAALVPARLLKETVDKLSDDVIELVVEDGTARVGATTMRLLPIEDFPNVDGPLGEQILTISGPDLARALRQVVPAASKDEARPILTGVLFEASTDSLLLTATDSYRLHHAQVSASLDVGEWLGLVPASMLSNLAAHLNKKAMSGETVMLLTAGNGNGVTFRVSDDSWWTSRLIEGEFPNYRQIMPEPGDGSALEYDTELFDKIKAAGAIGASGVVTLRFSPLGGVQITANSPDRGGFSDSALVKYEGEELVTAYTAPYLLGCMEATNLGVGYIRDGLKPAMFVGDGCTACLMPVRMPAPVG